MKDKLSPTFIAAGAVIGLSIFVLLSMLFYGPSDYFERADVVAAEDGLRFSVASLFFKSFGVGAYLGWAIVLAWAVIVFFREAAGDLAVRAVSVVVLVFSGAVFAEMLGSGHLGGNVGFAIGSVLSAKFGSVLGLLVIGLVFGISLVLATDFGFISYYREARESLAVAELERPEEVVDDEDEEPSDLLARIEQTVREVEQEAAEEDQPEAEVTVEEEAPAKDADRLLMVDLKPRIEEETLDEELLVQGEDRGPREHLPMEESATLVTTEEEPEAKAVEVEAPTEIEESVETEIVVETETFVEESEAPVAAEEPEVSEAPVEEEPDEPRAGDLETVFDALLGPRTEAPAAEEPAGEAPDEVVSTRPVLVDDELVVVEGPQTPGVSEETFVDEKFF
ncbi:MAG: DNA translocase FtsK 4TM domain-containing protein, partial [Planctomycetota bacterium]